MWLPSSVFFCFAFSCLGSVFWCFLPDVLLLLSFCSAFPSVYPSYTFTSYFPFSFVERPLPFSSFSDVTWTCVCSSQLSLSLWHLPRHTEEDLESEGEAANGAVDILTNIYDTRKWRVGKKGLCSMCFFVFFFFFLVINLLFPARSPTTLISWSLPYVCSWLPTVTSPFRLRLLPLSPHLSLYLALSLSPPPFVTLNVPPHYLTLLLLLPHPPPVSSPPSPLGQSHETPLRPPSNQPRLNGFRENCLQTCDLKLNLFFVLVYV